MSNGSLGDSCLLSEAALLAQAALYVRPGTVLLGHPKHPTATWCCAQILELIWAQGASLGHDRRDVRDLPADLPSAVSPNDRRAFGFRRNPD
jgi:hypothetical protein